MPQDPRTATASAAAAAPKPNDEGKGKGAEDVGLKEEIMNLVTGARPKAKDSAGSRARELFGSSSSEDEDGDSEPEVIPTRKRTTVFSRSRGEPELASDGYDEDGFGDTEDRRRLMAMTEIEREAVLYERAQARQARLERRELERKVRELELLEQQKSSATASTSAAEKKRRTLGKLKALRQKRQKKASGQLVDDNDEEEEEDEYDEEEGYEEGQVQSEEDEEEASYDDDDRYEASDDDYYGAKKKTMAAPVKITTAKKGTAEPLTLELANRIRMTRDLIAKWIYHPDFDRLAANSLVRLAIGSTSDGSQIYRLVEVKRVVPYYRAYKIGGSSGPTTINKAALLRYGKSERTFRLDVVSNSDFTQAEYERWMTVLREEKQPVLSQRAAEAKAEDWEDFKAKPVSDETVHAMVKAKKDLGQGHRNLIAEKTALTHALEQAQAEGNQEDAEALHLELGDLLREIEEVQAKKACATKRLDALAEINKRNRQLNVSIAREAERLTSNRAISNGPSQLDPFSRRRCQPSSNFDAVDEADGQEAVAAAPAAVEEPNDTQLEVTPVVKGLDPFAAAHDVDIDIDI